MNTRRLDLLNALKTRSEGSGQEWSPVDGVADDLGQNMRAIEGLLDPCVDEGLGERRGTDQDPEYRLTRAAVGS
jgi:hypothetical protein